MTGVQTCALPISKYNEENRFKQDSENAIYMFDKDNGEPEVLDETEDVESAGDVAETAATAEAVEDIRVCQQIHIIMQDRQQIL